MIREGDCIDSTVASSTSISEFFSSLLEPTEMRLQMPFHAVRTKFLGTIASTDLYISSRKMVEALWGSTLPAFDNLGAASELIGALIMGLWNRLTRHQRTLGAVPPDTFRSAGDAPRAGETRHGTPGGA